MNPIHTLRTWRWTYLGRLKIRKQIRALAYDDKLNVVVGAANTHFKGWIVTDLPHFNLLKETDWHFFFSKRHIDSLLAEHVLEHLSETEVHSVLRYAHSFMNPNGRFRIAVPDKNNPDPAYQAIVRPPYHGHNSFWDFKSLVLAAQKHQFSVDLLEYYDEKGIFNQANYTQEGGHIMRSRLNQFYSPDMPNYTSLIVDLRKEP